MAAATWRMLPPSGSESTRPHPLSRDVSLEAPTSARRDSFGYCTLDPQSAQAQVMSREKKTCCVVEVLGAPRCLFTLEERPDQTVIVACQSAEMMGRGLPKEYEGREINNQKYSIHPSFGSETEINYITLEIKIPGIEQYREEHVTGALKMHNKFVSIVVVRCSDLRLERYKPGGGSRANWVLGSYDPERESLMYGVFVGNRERGFSVEQNLVIRSAHCISAVFGSPFFGR